MTVRQVINELLTIRDIDKEIDLVVSLPTDTHVFGVHQLNNIMIAQTEKDTIIDFEVDSNEIEII